MTAHQAYFHLLLLSVLILSLDGVQHANAKEAGFEEPPVLSASDFLPAELVKGEYHQVQEEVINDGYMNHYRVTSSFGNYEVTGTPMLARRIHEINALAVLAEQTTTRVAIDTGKKVGTKIATSSVEATKKLGATVSNPEELGSMVRAVPGGVANLFGYAADKVGAGAKQLSGSESKEGAENSEGEGDEGSGSGSQVSAKATDAALRYTGYSSARARWAQELEIDPYTDNELLLSEIRRVATTETSVGLAGKLVPSTPSIPGVSQANKWLDRMEDISLYDDPAKIAELNEKIMRSLTGDGATIKAFTENQNFTPTTRTLLLSGIQALENVDGTDELLAKVATAKTPGGAWYYVFVVQQLVETHQQRPLARVVQEIPLPAAITEEGVLILPLPVDYLVWTEDVAAILKDAHQRIIEKSGGKALEAIMTGGASERAQHELKILGFTMIQAKESR
jgi:hypothetical protein